MGVTLLDEYSLDLRTSALASVSTHVLHALRRSVRAHHRGLPWQIQGHQEASAERIWDGPEGEWAGKNQQRTHESRQLLAQLDEPAGKPERCILEAMERMAQQASKCRHDEADRKRRIN